VELEEGPVMVSTIIGTESDHLRCDLPLELDIVTTSAGQGIPLFRIVV
jgi:hypothetical protein